MSALDAAEAAHLMAAAAAGRLVAQRLLSPDEILPPILAAHPGERAAILARFDASRAAMTERRLAAARAIGAALAPLIAARAAGSTLLAATGRADPAGLLHRHERRGLAERMIRAALERHP
jgi:hypothetical protein